MLLFSVRFLRQVAIWGSEDAVAAHYDRRFGQASASEQDAFREAVRVAGGVSNWVAFAERWDAETGGISGEQSLVARLGSGQVVAALRESEANSTRKGYHARAV